MSFSLMVDAIIFIAIKERTVLSRVMYLFNILSLYHATSASNVSFSIAYYDHDRCRFTPKDNNGARQRFEKKPILDR